MRLPVAAMATWLVAVSASVGPHQCDAPMAPARPRYDMPVAPTPTPAPDIDRVVRITLTMADLATLVHWHDYAETRPEQDDEELLLAIKHALADLKRANGLDLTPGESVFALDAN